MIDMIFQHQNDCACISGSPRMRLLRFRLNEFLLLNLLVFEKIVLLWLGQRLHFSLRAMLKSNFQVHQEGMNLLQKKGQDLKKGASENLKLSSFYSLTPSLETLVSEIKKKSSPKKNLLDPWLQQACDRLRVDAFLEKAKGFCFPVLFFWKKDPTAKTEVLRSMKTDTEEKGAS